MSRVVTGPDQGAARERTALAWQRTALAVLGGALLQFRLTYEQDAPAVLAVIAAGGMLAVLTVAESRRRHPTASLTQARGGRVALLLAASVALLLVAELAVVLTGR